MPLYNRVVGATNAHGLAPGSVYTTARGFLIG